MSGGEIELAKEQDNWQFVRPIKARASNDAVVEILTKMNQTQISKFVPENKSNPGSFGLDTPADVLISTAGKGKSSRLPSGALFHPIHRRYTLVFRNETQSSK